MNKQLEEIIRFSAKKTIYRNFVGHTKDKDREIREIIGMIVKHSRENDLSRSQEKILTKYVAGASSILY